MGHGLDHVAEDRDRRRSVVSVVSVGLISIAPVGRQPNVPHNKFHVPVP